MPEYFFIRAVWAALLALVCAFAGILIAGGRRARLLVPVSGLLLTGVAIFGLIPELVDEIGWVPGLILVGAGYGLLHLLDRAGLPVCPSCSHGHGFSAPLVAATAAHAFVDGWGMVAVGVSSPGNISVAIGTAILLHKIPEGLALGSLLRSSTGQPRRAMWLAAIAELPTIAGGALGFWGTPVRWIHYPLAVAGGTFLFLGLHAMDEWTRARRVA